MKTLGMITSVVLVLVIGTFIWGFAGMTLWNWFVTPFFALPQLTFTHALGLGLLVRVFIPLNQLHEKKEETFEQRLCHAIGASIAPLISVLLGWIVLQFL